MILGGEMVAVVTGGASGLGEAVVRAFAEESVRVGIFDVDSDGGEALAAEIGGVFAQVDVADARSVDAGFKASRAAIGQERVLVNCAGIAPPARTVSKGIPHDSALFEQVLRINLMGSFLCASRSAAGMCAMPSMGDDGERGVIINTASVAAFEGQIGQSAYAASKGGVVAMTLPMARDLARYGIRVVSVAPGIFATPMLRGLPEDVQRSLGTQVPFPTRLGNPAEFAALARHIVENPLLNGETIRLDGAVRMGMR